MEILDLESTWPTRVPGGQGEGGGEGGGVTEQAQENN